MLPRQEFGSNKSTQLRLEPAGDPGRELWSPRVDPTAAAATEEEGLGSKQAAVAADRAVVADGVAVVGKAEAAVVDRAAVGRKQNRSQ